MESRPVFGIRIRESSTTRVYVPLLRGADSSKLGTHDDAQTKKRAMYERCSFNQSERGYRSRVAVTLGQGLGQLDSTYLVLRKGDIDIDTKRRKQRENKRSKREDR